MAVSFKDMDNYSTEKETADEKYTYKEKCGICDCNYDTPKTLKCLHSFCLKCLSGKVYAGKNQVTCPTCDVVTILATKGVEGLNTNYMLVKEHERRVLENQLGKKEAPIPCTSCENDKENKAVVWCRQCQDYMCEMAAKYHKEQKISRGHEVIPLETLREEGIPKAIRANQKDRMCPRHTDEKLIFYCETCEVPFCRNCEVIDHPRGKDHAQVYLEDAVQKRITEIQAEAEKCKNVGRAVDNTLAQDERVGIAHRKAVEQNICAYNDASKKAEVLFSDKLKQHKDTFSAELTKFDETRKQKVDKHKGELKKIRSRISSALAITEMLVETGTSFDVADMYKDVITALRQLRDFTPEPELMSEIALQINSKCLPVIESVPALATLKLGVLGKNIWECKRTFGSTPSLRGARGLAFTSNGGLVVADNRYRAALFNSSGDLLNVIPYQTASFNYPFDVCYNPADGFYYVSDGTFTVKRLTYSDSQISYNSAKNVGGGSYIGYGLAAMNDGNWAVCCKDNNMIYVYNSGGGQVRTVPAMKPNFLSSTPGNNFVITSESQKSVQVIDSSGRLLQVIGPPPGVTHSQWNPQGVCCSKNDEVYVANQGNGALYRFKSTGDFIDCVASNLSNPWGVAISADDTQVAVVHQNGAEINVFTHRI